MTVSLSPMGKYQLVVLGPEGNAQVRDCASRLDNAVNDGGTFGFVGLPVLRIQNGKIAQEIGLDDGVKALTQLGLIKAGLNRR